MGREVLGTDHATTETETGGIMIANYAARDVHPGSMGTTHARDHGGRTAAAARRVGAGGSRTDTSRSPRRARSGTRAPPWPSMFRAHLDEEQRYNKCFVDGWYLTGDHSQTRRMVTSGSSGARTTSSDHQAPDQAV